MVASVKEEVVYKDIPGCPGYRAGSDGSIWSCWRPKWMGYGKGSSRYMSDKWKMLKPYPRKVDGRKRQTIKAADGSYRTRYVSTYVLEAFVGPKPEGMECCHNDGDCTNDAIDNLRWDTVIANKADMVKHGTRLSGERHPVAKLQRTDVDIIRELRKQGWKLKDLANMYSVTETNISYICRGKSWNDE